MDLERTLQFEDITKKCQLYAGREHTFIYEQNNLSSCNIDGERAYFSIGKCKISDLQIKIEEFIKSHKAYELYQKRFKDAESVDLCFVINSHNNIIFTKKYRITGLEIKQKPKYDFPYKKLSKIGSYNCILFETDSGLYPQFFKNDCTEQEAENKITASNKIRLYYGCSFNFFDSVLKFIKEPTNEKLEELDNIFLEQKTFNNT